MATTFNDRSSDTTHANHPTLDLNVNSTSTFTGRANHTISQTFGFTTDDDFLEIDIRDGFNDGPGSVDPGSSIRVSFLPASAHFYRVTGRYDSYENIHGSTAFPGSTSTFLRNEPGAPGGDEATINIPQAGSLPQHAVLEIRIVAGGPPDSTYPQYSPLDYELRFVNFGVIGGGGGGGGGGSDQSDNTGTTGQVAPGSSVNGNIDPAGDRDWFRVQLAAGTSYLIDLEGSPSNAGTLADPYLRIYDASGNLVGEDDDSGDGFNSRVLFTPGNTGTYFIGAGEFGDNATGTYRVNVSSGVGGTPDLNVLMRGVEEASVPRGGNITFHFDYSNFGTASSSVSTFGVYISTDATITTSDTLMTFLDFGTVEAGQTISVGGGGPLPQSIGPGDYYIGVIADYLNQVGESNEGNNASAGLPFTVTAATDAAAPNDFDGDGDSDILWRHAEGLTVTWEMEGGTNQGNRNHGSVPTPWRISATGDFDGDGDADILWRHTDGLVVTWEMENGAYVTNHNIAFASTGWDIVNTGDFDGDGDADVLWRHRDGAVVTWEMEDGGYVRNHNIAFASVGWTIQGLGDFDGDGDDDIIWRHRDGAVVTWEMDNGEYVQNHNIAFASTGWDIRGTGDFDGDGDDDILWRHRDGAVVTWEMDNGAYVSNHNIAFASTGWQVEGTGDFNADGTSDILWRHSDGQVVTWEMDGGEFLQSHSLGAVSNAWQIV